VLKNLLLALIEAHFLPRRPRLGGTTFFNKKSPAKSNPLFYKKIGIGPYFNITLPWFIFFIKQQVQI
jgi:hypothetical protein